MTKTGAYKIRPAGRLVLTIGRDLIQDSHAAVVELVKNAYDADSPDVHVEFVRKPKRRNYTITITDHGHGMTRDDVITKWMVPSTTDKLKRRRSPSGRVMQGRKGVGRYAASILGNDLMLETVSADGEQTEAYIDWNEFEVSEYLDDVEILVETTQTRMRPGTKLTISSQADPNTEWSSEQFNKLRFELKRLKSPVGMRVAEDDLEIRLAVRGFPKVEDIDEVIEPFPIMELFDYRITGIVDAQGAGQLIYSQQKIANSPDHVIDFDYKRPTNCGDIQFDVRVYDRDTESLGGLIHRDSGLTDPQGSYLGILQARQLLNQYNGIGVYRHGFRIRPLGDPDFDWLELNKKRIQNPSLRIGSNQAIGLVHVQSDEESGLIEKSARDGLKDNYSFQHLKEITRLVIEELETRRFEFRRMSDSVKPSGRIERQLELILSYEELKHGISSTLTRANVTQDTRERVMNIIAQDQDQRSRAIQEIQQAVATYQGQATLGKIINAILHEGRRPLNYFRNEIRNIRYSYKEYQATQDKTRLHTILTIANGIAENAEFLVDLFRRVDPLAARRRSNKITINIGNEIGKSIDVFRAEIASNNITIDITCPENVTHFAWRQDIYIIFTNLIENSIYWLTQYEYTDKRIDVFVECEDGRLKYIDYRDTGPGIDPHLIASEVIFEPQFTTKPSGSGLGLPIAGEAAARIGLELSALESDTGAWFRLQAIEAAAGV